MQKKKYPSICIIHFLPLELYPPVMNLIDFLSKNYEGKILVLTTIKAHNNKLSIYQNDSLIVRIKRMRFSGSNFLTRLLEYFLFYLEGLILLFRFNPKSVLYFESISSWPALIYKRLKRSKIRLMVHYHEYTDPRSSEEKTFLSGWMHKIEQRMYHHFSWISHTNEVRLQMFKDDNDLNDLPLSLFHVVPNYPSRSWITESNGHYSNEKVKKLVFVGSLGYDNMYLQEMIDWLGKHQDEFSLDIYSHNMDEKAKAALQEQSLDNVRYCGSTDYAALPKILKSYDVGLVIYKPYSQNTIHAVSNKVFEYMACGLDTWFSEDMAYTMQYSRIEAYPKLVPVNFKQLDSFDYLSALSKENLNYEASGFFYENVYAGILNWIKTGN